MVPGGVFITEQYADNIEVYEPVLARIGVTPLWLPSGEGVIVKRWPTPALASAPWL
jgi:hypothetical protein